jgi:F-type H+-transporting ATPase subunit epsilon
MAEAFKFELVSPARLVLSEEASQVVVPGLEGDFTMLSGHSPFMTTAGVALLRRGFDGGSIGAGGLLAGALGPTVLAAAAFLLL